MSADAKSSNSVEREVAFYYPGPVWYSGDWIKNLILFFDGVALLVPEYISDKPDIVDPAIDAGLRKEGLLHILEPEKVVDKSVTEKLATVMTDIITSGLLDPLAKENTRFHELSFSRLGSFGDVGLATMIFDELKARGLALDTKDGVSIPMHPKVRVLVLVLLAQILSPHGQKLGFELSPATDVPQLVEALSEMLSVPKAPSSGHLVSLDLETVGVDLGSVPIDEILDFRRQHFEEHRAYVRSIRKFLQELSLISERERARALADRQAEIQDLSQQLKTISRQAWKRPASFALTISGAVWTLKTGDAVGALLAAAGALLGSSKQEETRAGMYSYLFRAAQRYPF